MAKRFGVLLCGAKLLKIIGKKKDLRRYKVFAKAMFFKNHIHFYIFDHAKISNG